MYVPPPPPVRRGGVSSGVVVLVVLLWVFVGWPVSWMLLFLFAPLGILFGIGITVGLIVFLATAGRRPVPPPVTVNMGPVPPRPAGPPVPPHVAARHHAVRQEVESLAFVDAAGGCGWCGSSSAHVDGAGRQVHPRQWHGAEIEDRIRGKSGP